MTKTLGPYPHRFSAFGLTSGEGTRGVDVGARAEIYAHILRRLADQALAIMFASSDNQEILGLACDTEP